MERVNPAEIGKCVGVKNVVWGQGPLMDDTDAGREIGRALEDAQSKATELQAKIMQFQVAFSSLSGTNVEQALEEAGANFQSLSGEISPLLQSIIRCEVAVRSQLNLFDMQLSSANCHTRSQAPLSGSNTPRSHGHPPHTSMQEDGGTGMLPNHSDVSEKDMADAVLSQLNSLLQQAQQGHSGVAPP